MVRLSELTKACYRPRDIAGYLGVTVRTLQVWDKEGRISFQRDPSSDRRYMSRDRVIALLQERGLLLDDTPLRQRDIVYGWVASSEKEEVLHEDLHTLLAAYTDLNHPQVLMESGRFPVQGRSGILTLLRGVLRGEVARVFVLSEDRLPPEVRPYVKAVLAEKHIPLMVLRKETSYDS